MARTIMISDEAYAVLTKLKRKGESYTKLIERTMGAGKSKGSLLECAGLWKLPNEKIRLMKKHILESRNYWREPR